MASYWLYGVLADDPSGSPERIVCYKGDFRAERLPPIVANLPLGAAVLLQGKPGAFTNGYREYVTPWDAPSIGAIRAGTTGEDRLAFADVVPKGFAVDEDGIACELGRLGERVVLNYSGWKLLSYGAARVPVTLAQVGSVPVAIVEADVDIAALLARRATREAFACDEVEWRNGEIVFPSGPVACARASALIEPVRDHLARFARAPVVLVTGDGEPYVELPPAYAEFLRSLPRLRVEIAARRSREGGLRPVREVLDEAGVVGEDPEQALVLDDLGLTPRQAAFRRLFSLRSRVEQPFMWASHAVLVPIDSARGTLWAWEVVEDGHATYLFRPERFSRLAAWLSQAGVSREATREEPGLGFVDRVRHDTVDGWWEALRAKLVSLGCELP